MQFSQSVSQFFHGPAPRSPLHRLAVRLRHSRSNTSTEYSLLGATQLSQVRSISPSGQGVMRVERSKFAKRCPPWLSSSGFPCWQDTRSPEWRVLAKCYVNGPHVWWMMLLTQAFAGRGDLFCNRAGEVRLQPRYCCHHILSSLAKSLRVPGSTQTSNSTAQEEERIIGRGLWLFYWYAHVQPRAGGSC